LEDTTKDETTLRSVEAAQPLGNWSASSALSYK